MNSDNKSSLTQRPQPQPSPTPEGPFTAQESGDDRSGPSDMTRLETSGGQPVMNEDRGSHLYFCPHKNQGLRSERRTLEKPTAKDRQAERLDAGSAQRCVDRKNPT